MASPRTVCCDGCGAGGKKAGYAWAESGHSITAVEAVVKFATRPSECAVAEVADLLDKTVEEIGGRGEKRIGWRVIHWSCSRLMSHSPIAANHQEFFRPFSPNTGDWAGWVTSMPAREFGYD
jgi:hypothetical protein